MRLSWVIKIVMVVMCWWGECCNLQAGLSPAPLVLNKIVVASQFFKFDSALNSADRIMFADALVQPIVEDFEKKLMKALKFQKISQVMWKVVAAPLAVAPVVATPYIFTGGRPLRGTGTAGVFSIALGGVIGVSISAVLSPVVIISHLKRAQKRIDMYHKFIQHSDLLFALLDSSSFKQSIGVSQWNSVRKKRRIGEFAGLGAALGGVLGCGLMFDRASNLGVIMGAGIGVLFSQWALKPIIAKAIRKKGGAPELEQAFESAIEIYERTGVVPYGATLDTSRPTGGTVSSAAYQDSGMQSTSYAVESARDKYLRLLAGRAVAKKEAAQEASGPAQD